MRRLRVLLDANVLVDALARDLFLRLAEAYLIDVCWSEPIMGELRRTLEQRRGLPQTKVDRLVAALDRAFPDASLAGFDHLVPPLALRDPGDRHVLAAAIHGECDLLVTYNTRDFDDHVTEPWDVVVLDVDDALLLLFEWFPNHLVTAVHQQVAALRMPPTSYAGFLARLARSAPRAAKAIGAAFS